MSGQKHDGGKLRYDLVDPLAEAEMVAVLTYGAAKYEAWNWLKVDDPMARYTAALRRHLAAFLQDEEVDSETGLHHLAHLACCAHFMLGLRLRAGVTDEHPDSELVESLPERLRKALEAARAFKGDYEARSSSHHASNVTITGPDPKR